jgi:hypothetical protein
MDEENETIEVLASVYKAAEALEVAAVGDEGFRLAELIKDYYRSAGVEKREAFWQQVYDYLMTKTCVSKDARTVIIPDAEP